MANYGKRGEELFKRVLKVKADETVLAAKNLARINKGKLRQGISREEVEGSDGKKYRIVASMPYSAYHEFGTITKVDIPPGFEEMASQFKGKGIRKTGGITPKPFLYPAWVKSGQLFIKDLQQVIKTLK